MTFSLYEALADNRVERVPHLVGYSRVDQSDKLLFCLQVIIEYFRRNINELDCVVPFLVILKAQTLFDLEEFEGWYVFL